MPPGHAVPPGCGSCDSRCRRDLQAQTPVMSFAPDRWRQGGRAAVSPWRPLPRSRDPPPRAAAHPGAGTPSPGATGSNPRGRPAAPQPRPTGQTHRSRHCCRDSRREARLGPAQPVLLSGGRYHPPAERGRTAGRGRARPERHRLTPRPGTRWGRSRPRSSEPGTSVPTGPVWAQCPGTAGRGDRGQCPGNGWLIGTSGPRYRERRVRGNRSL